jgi:hypothetical protein
MGLYKRGQATPSRGENPEDKSWSSKMGVGHRANNSFPEETISAMKSQSNIASWIFGKRTRQCKRIKTTEFNIATWIVQSVFQAGKMEEIADELKKYNIQITALQEVRWPHDGWIKKKNILDNGLKTSKGQHGTGFLITGCATQCIIGFELINESMCK